MVGQVGGYARTPGGPLALRIILCFYPQTLVKTNSVIVSVFPSHSGLVQLDIFLENQGLAGQASIRKPCCRVTALDVNRTFAQQFNEFFLVAPDSFQNGCEIPCILEKKGGNHHK